MSDIKQLLQQFSMLAVGDSSFTPKPFAGGKKDGDAVEKWLDYFQQYVTFRQLDNGKRLQLFKLLLVEQAADWLKTLPDAIANDYNTLLIAFQQRFALTELQKWKKAAHMWEREQKTGESVDTYITEMKRAAKQIPITDQRLIRFAIIRGLRPQIRLHVLQSQADSLDKVVEAARVAEAALEATNSDADKSVTELTKQISVLIDQLQQQQTLATAQMLSQTGITTASTNDVVNVMRQPRQQAVQTTTTTENERGYQPRQFPAGRQRPQVRSAQTYAQSYQQPQQQQNFRPRSVPPNGRYTWGQQQLSQRNADPQDQLNRLSRFNRRNKQVVEIVVFSMHQEIVQRGNKIACIVAKLDISQEFVTPVE